jgi:predicted ester cyclase
VSTGENKALVRRFYEEVWAAGTPSSRSRSSRHDFRGAFPDLRVTIDVIIGEGDFVVGRWTATGTHLGPWGAAVHAGAAPES